MSAITYMFDYTGTFGQNLVQNEVHPLTEANFRDFFYVIPKYAPFFTNNLSITYKTGNTVIPLVVDVDYYLALPFYGATRSIGVPVYGAIAFNNKYTHGSVSISYQTIGGTWVCNTDDLYTALANLAYNPRIVPYDQIANTPTTFPPINHNQGLTSVMGQDALVAAIEGVGAAIVNKVIDYQNDLAVVQANLKQYIDNYLISRGI